nr:MAG TPA: hypothetical protein [Caudoviricetes sp.]
MRHKYKGRFAKLLTLEWSKTSHCFIAHWRCCFTMYITLYFDTRRGLTLVDD